MVRKAIGKNKYVRIALLILIWLLEIKESGIFSNAAGNFVMDDLFIGAGQFFSLY